MPLQIRRGTDAERTAMTQPLAAGELIFVSNTQRLFIGNGTTLGGIPITGYTNEDAQDAVAPMFVGGTHSGINFAYNDASNIINATVDLSDYNGTIRASSFKGTIVADDSTALVDAVDGRIFLDGTVKGNIVPNADVAYDLGSATYRFRDLYLSGSSIKLGAATITAVGDAVNLPLGSTMGGVPLAGGAGSDFKGNIIGDDSTIIVNVSTKVVTAGGGFIGNVTGNVNGVITGNIFTNLIDSTDSSAIVVTPTVSFQSDVLVENDLFVNDNLRNNQLTFTADRLVSNTSFLRIGSDTDNTNLEIIGDDGEPVIRVKSTLTGSPGLGQQGPRIQISSTQGTFTSPTALGAGDMCGVLLFGGYVNLGSQGITQLSDLTAIRSVVTDPGDIVSNYAKGKLQFLVANQDNPAISKVAEFNDVGVFSAPVLQPGVYANNAARDAAITAPSAGMIVFNTTGTKFQGYTGAAWVDLN